MKKSLAAAVCLACATQLAGCTDLLEQPAPSPSVAKVTMPRQTAAIDPPRRLHCTRRGDDIYGDPVCIAYSVN